MAMSAVCLFNKYGHCRFRETCRKHHNNEVYENELCEKVNCEKRHPKRCKYFDFFNRCKFGSFCSFAHRTSQKGSNEELQAKVFDLDKRVEDLEKDIKQANLKIAEK